MFHQYRESLSKFGSRFKMVATLVALVSFLPSLWAQDLAFSSTQAVVGGGGSSNDNSGGGGNPDEGNDPDNGTNTTNGDTTNPMILFGPKDGPAWVVGGGGSSNDNSGGGSSGGGSGGSGGLAPQKFQVVQSVRDDSGNTFFTGWFEDQFQVSDHRITSNGGRDLFLCKMDAWNNVLWLVPFGGEGEEEGSHLMVTTDGGLVVAGTMTGDVFLEDWEPLLAQGHRDVFILRLTSEGEWLWTRRLGGSGYETIIGLATTKWDEPHLHLSSTHWMNYGQDMPHQAFRQEHQITLAPDLGNPLSLRMSNLQ